MTPIAIDAPRTIQATIITNPPNRDVDLGASSNLYRIAQSGYSRESGFTGPREVLLPLKKRPRHLTAKAEYT
jgi:hypothetical protein